MVGYVTVVFDGKEDVSLGKKIFLKKKKIRDFGNEVRQYSLRGWEDFQDGERGGKQILVFLLC